nr:MAG: RNA dependent RNA polymerase [Hameenlinna totivirus 2]
MVVEGEVIKINKHVLFEKLTAEEMNEWIDSEPKTEAVGSEKYEMGKARAIYGTKPVDYAISAYVLNEIEPRMNLIVGIEAGLTGLDVIAGLFERRRRAMTPRTECSMIDYKDFNYQHTLKAQAVVFDAIARLFEFVRAHPDKAKAARWTSEALLNQWCRFPGDKSAIKITQGMFSGCRGTNFINTTLNLAYFLIAEDWVRKHLELGPVALYHIHQGDDVWVSNKSRLWAMCIFKVMQETGFDFQGKKQMFDVCRAEFLRVLYSKEGCMGYLSRAVATLIVKPIQSADINGPAERALALNSQINIIYRRGFTYEGARILWQAIIPYASRVNLPKGGFSIPLGVLKLHPKQGGLGLLPPGEMSSSPDFVKVVPTYQSYNTDLAAAVPFNMSDDWIKHISKTIKHNFDAESLRLMVHDSNVSDSLRPKDKRQGLIRMEVELRGWKDGLRSPKVESSVKLMDDFLNITANMAEEDRMCLALTLGYMRKKNEKNPGMLRCICLAISMCPYKNIPAASVSLKGEWQDIVRACIAMCPRTSVASKAIVSFNDLVKGVGIPVTQLLLDGQNLGVGMFEFKWHPIVLSWVRELSCERAALVLLDSGCASIVEAKDLVQSEFDKAVRVLNKYDGMSEVSRY